MKPLSYLEIARHALEHKEHDLFKLAVKNRRRVLNKEKALAVGQQSAKASTPTKDTLNPSYQNGA